MKIHTGDTVVVITGKDKGKTGTVIRVLTDRNQVVVQGINMRTRHIKKTTQGPGQRIKYEASLHVCKVMIVDPKTKKPTRIGFKVDDKTGKKVRIAKASGSVIEVAKAKPTEKKTAKKTETAAKPAKSAFWKGGKSAPEGDASETGAAASAADAEQRHTPIVQRRSRGS